MSVGRVLVSAFDVRLWDEPVDKDAWNPKIAFLGDAAAYRAARNAQEKKPVSLVQLFVFPVVNSNPGKKKRKGNHFWPRYLRAAFHEVDAAVPSSRDFLIPLRCRPKSLDLKFLAPNTQQPVKVWATIWLWPFGWSSVLEFEIKGGLDFDALRAIHESLPSNPGPFLLNGKPCPIHKVFQFLSEMVRQDIVLPGKGPEDTLKVPRQIVMSTWLAKGSAARRYDGDGPVWPANQRWRMHGAVRGKVMDLDGLKALEPEDQPRRYLLTQLGPDHFAITHFDKGTLLVLRHWSDAGRSRGTNHCLTANIRNFSVVVQTLIALIRDQAAGKPPDQGIAADAIGLLNRLATTYRNPICAPFLAHHKTMQRSAHGGKSSTPVDRPGLAEET